MASSFSRVRLGEASSSLRASAFFASPGVSMMPWLFTRWPRKPEHKLSVEKGRHTFNTFLKMVLYSVISRRKYLPMELETLTTLAPGFRMGKRMSQAAELSQ